jgi:hypothetical protein
MVGKRGFSDSGIVVELQDFTSEKELEAQVWLKLKLSYQSDVCSSWRNFQRQLNQTTAQQP